MFGVPVEIAVRQTKLPDGIELPKVFREGIIYIEDQGELINMSYAQLSVVSCFINLLPRLL